MPLNNASYNLVQPEMKSDAENARDSDDAAHSETEELSTLEPCNKFKRLKILQKYENFYCFFCPKEFETENLQKSWSEFREHIKCHPKTRCVKYKIPCEVCGKKISSSSRTDHLKLHAGETFKCSDCPKIFRQKASFVAHTKAHTGNLFTCRFCIRSYTVRRRLEDHERMHTGEKPYKCNQCDKCFRSMNLLRYHRRTTHSVLKSSVKPKTKKLSALVPCEDKFRFFHKHFKILQQSGKFYCCFCPKEYDTENLEKSWSDFMEHIKCHPKTVRVQYKILCEVCGKKIHRSTRIKHMKLHAGRDFFKCSDCPKSFRSKSSLDAHTKTHTGNLLTCRFCNKGCIYMKQLKDHERKHTGEKPYKCNQCDKCFRSMGCLYSHRKTHIVAKPYPCKYCKRSFTQQKHYDTHLKFHTDRGRNCKCEICNQVFKYASAYLKHLRVHKRQEPFPCDQCTKTFITKKRLHNHYKSKHVIENSEPCEVLQIPIEIALQDHLYFQCYTDSERVVTESTSSASNHSRNYRRQKTTQKQKSLAEVPENANEATFQIMNYTSHTESLINNEDNWENEKGISIETVTSYVEYDGDYCNNQLDHSKTVITGKLNFTKEPKYDCSMEECQTIDEPDAIVIKMNTDIVESENETDENHFTNDFMIHKDDGNSYLLSESHLRYEEEPIAYTEHQEILVQDPATFLESSPSLTKNIFLSNSVGETVCMENDVNNAKSLTNSLNECTHEDPIITTADLNHRNCTVPYRKKINSKRTGQIKNLEHKKKQLQTEINECTATTNTAKLETVVKDIVADIVNFVNKTVQLGHAEDKCRGKDQDNYLMNTKGDLSLAKDYLNFVQEHFYQKDKLTNEDLISKESMEINRRKIYSCAHCSKTFIFAKHLLCHLKTHMGSSICSCEDCTMRCSQSESQRLGGKGKENKFANKTALTHTRPINRLVYSHTHASSSGLQNSICNASVNNLNPKESALNNKEYSVYVEGYVNQMEDQEIRSGETRHLKKDFSTLEPESNTNIHTIDTQNDENFTMCSQRLCKKLSPRKFASKNIVATKRVRKKYTKSQNSKNFNDGKVIQTIPKRSNTEGVVLTSDSELGHELRSHEEETIHNTKRPNSSKFKRYKILQKYEKFYCFFCPKEFETENFQKSWSEFREHIKCHPKTRCVKYKILCEVCGKKISSSSRTDHLKLHAGEIFKCSDCPKTFRQKASFVAHTKTHTGNLFKCRFCIKGYTIRRLLEAHERIHTGEKPYKCNQCDKCFRSMRFLWYHRRTTHSVLKSSVKPKTKKLSAANECKTNLYECKDCNKTFRYKRSWNYHLKIWHERKYLCRYCFNHILGKTEFKKHLQTHRKEKRYTCKYCSKSIRHKSSLYEHYKIHEGRKPYSCGYCGKAFRQSSNLTCHMKLHTGDNKYTCDYCEKSFVHQLGLTEHIRLHTGERPHVCPHCGKTYSRVFSYELHLKTHTVDKPFACHVCKRRYTTKEGRDSHLHFHESSKRSEPVFCPVCSKQFSIPSKLKRHMKVHAGKDLYSGNDCNEKLLDLQEPEGHEEIHIKKDPYVITVHRLAPENVPEGIELIQPHEIQEHFSDSALKLFVQQSQIPITDIFIQSS